MLFWLGQGLQYLAPASVSAAPGPWVLLGVGRFVCVVYRHVSSSAGSVVQCDQSARRMALH